MSTDTNTTGAHISLRLADEICRLLQAAGVTDTEAKAALDAALAVLWEFLHDDSKAGG